MVTMKHTFGKLILKSITTSKSRFFSIFAIVAIGVGFFGGVKAAAPDMRENASNYYESHKLMHFRMLSSYGFSKDEIETLKKMDDVEIYPSYFGDYILENKEGGTVCRTYALGGNGKDVNKIELKDGKMPTSDKECLLSAKSKIPVGEKITLKSGKKDEKTGLKTNTYTVVGHFTSPMYVTDTQLGSADIGDGKIGVIALLPKENYESDYYSEIYVRCKALSKVESGTDEYDDCADRLLKMLEKQGDKARKVRLDALKAKAEKEVSKNEKKLQKSEKELQKGKNALNDAKENLKTLKAQIKMLEQYKKSLAARQSTTIGGLSAQSLQSGAKLTGSDSSVSTDSGSAPTIPDSNTAAIASSRAATIAGSSTATVADDLGAAAIVQKTAAAAQIENGSTAVGLDEKTLAAIGQLDALKAQYATASEEITAKEKELEKAEKKLENGQKKLADAKKKIEKLEAPTYYITDRADLPSYTEYSENADRIGNIAKLFPVFFLLVAALVSLTTMTRMVEEERTQIGTLKALGYKNSSIFAKYLIYALSAATLGAVFGLVVGFKVFPFVIMYAYTILYNIPLGAMPFRPETAVPCILAAVGCVAVTVFSAVYSEVCHLPAQLMRPKAPPVGKRVLLERIPFLWNRLDFSRKVSTRNIFRYKKRMLMTVVGIAGCTALTLAGFGIRDAITEIVDIQYERLWTYDLIAVPQKADNDTYSEINDLLQKNGNSDILKVYNKTFTAKGDKKTADVNLFVPQKDKKLEPFVKLKSRTTDEKYTLSDDTVIITEKLSTLLHKKVGDKITLTAGNNRVTLKIGAVAENYVYHYVYMSEALYEKTFQKAPEFNVYYCKFSGDTDAVAKALLSTNKLRAVTRIDTMMDTFNNIMNLFNLVILVLIVSAGILAFVVLYNLTNININERIREIATLKVLGFYDGEVSMYIFRENIVLTVVGIVFGLIFGRFLTSFVVKTAELDIVMFGREVKPLSYGIAAALTVVFSLIVSLFMHRRLKKISMVESLKSIE